MPVLRAFAPVLAVLAVIAGMEEAITLPGVAISLLSMVIARLFEATEFLCVAIERRSIAIKREYQAIMFFCVAFSFLEEAFAFQ